MTNLCIFFPSHNTRFSLFTSSTPTHALFRTHSTRMIDHGTTQFQTRTQPKQV
uniref:Uncharacterized protein n=1 Tax=Arundo donax TaxID=35708 RepID=A0A0A9G8H4_ARUDO